MPNVYLALVLVLDLDFGLILFTILEVSYAMGWRRDEMLNHFVAAFVQT